MEGAGDRAPAFAGVNHGAIRKDRSRRRTRPNSSRLQSLRRAGRPPRERAPEREPGYGRLQQLLREEILDGRIPGRIAAQGQRDHCPLRHQHQPGARGAAGPRGRGAGRPSRPTAGRGSASSTRTSWPTSSISAPCSSPTSCGRLSSSPPNEDIVAIEAIQKLCQAAADAGDYPAFHGDNNRFHDYMTDRHFNVEAVRIMKMHRAWVRALSIKHPLPPAHMQSVERRALADHRCGSKRRSRRGRPHHLPAHGPLARHSSLPICDESA